MFTSNAETEDGGLLNDLVITVTEDNNELVDVKKIGNNVISDWKFLPLVQNNEKVIKTINVSIELPFDTTGNEGVSGNIYFKVNAVQGNAHVENPKEDTDDVKYLYSDFKKKAQSSRCLTHIPSLIKCLCACFIRNRALKSAEGFCNCVSPIGLHPSLINF